MSHKDNCSDLYIQTSRPFKYATPSGVRSLPCHKLMRYIRLYLAQKGQGNTGLFHRSSVLSPYPEAMVSGPLAPAQANGHSVQACPPVLANTNPEHPLVDPFLDGAQGHTHPT